MTLPVAFVSWRAVRSAPRLVRLGLWRLLLLGRVRALVRFFGPFAIWYPFSASLLWLPIFILAFVCLRRACPRLFLRAGVYVSFRGSSVCSHPYSLADDRRIQKNGGWI